MNTTQNSEKKLTAAEEELYNKAMEWLRSEKPDNHAIALRFVRAVNTTYHLTKEQATNEFFMNNLRRTLLERVLR